jgi:hypothetical protein
LRRRVFAALFDATGACLRCEGEALERALRDVPTKALYAQAVRHKCAGLLLRGITGLRPRSSELSTLTGLLRRYAAAAAMDASATRAQVCEVLETLRGHSVPHALLKGSARLLAGDRIAEWTHMYDIDVLVPEDAAELAAHALLERGYRYELDSATIAGYRRYHQHLAPLLPPSGGKAVELHVALTLRSWFSLQCDWSALRWHMETIEGLDALQLDGFGRALHMAMHGAGLYRLGDMAQIAIELQRDPDLYSRLSAFLSGECVQPIPLFASLEAAAQLAGIATEPAPAVRRYVEWAVAREDLPKPCRGRMQLVDAWFANGGAWRGPSTRLAFPPAQRYDGTATGVLERSRILAGRVVAGLAAAGLRSLL